MNLQPGCLKKDLDRLIHALTVVREKTNESWYPIDVIHQMFAGKTFFMVSTLNDVDVAVLTMQQGQYTEDKTLWIWAAHSITGEAFEIYLDDFKVLAAELGCKSISWDSRRLGYTKVLNRIPGAVIERIEYRIGL
ncbi:MAG: hypothetical protein ACXWT5_09720 [Methylophilus sp.]|jgi:hypothetical protein